MAVESITLSTLNRQIRDVTQQAFPAPVWVAAEILEMHLNRSGHCYMELIEKSETDNKIIAKSRATIWSFKFRMLRPYFESTTGSQLQAGIKVLIRAEVSFHELYGLSLNITDIDPTYTMGDLARKKQEVLRKLDAAGVMNMNRDLPLTEVPQHIAVISSETAAGFGDFMDSLVNNNYGFGFRVSVFPAIVQGDAAEQSMIRALEQVFTMEEKYDAVVLIRGGGSQADLDCFNGYDLAMNIAQFPLPVLTGIGHERDETIADMVANRSLKTPTAVAEFLVDRLVDFSDKLSRLQERFSQSVQWIINEERTSLNQSATSLHHLTTQYMTREKHLLSDFRKSSESSVKTIINRERSALNDHFNRMKYLRRSLFEYRRRDLQHLSEKKHRVIGEKLSDNKEQLKSFERSLELLRPEKVLARGYSITWSGGRVVKSVENLLPGTTIETRLLDGTIESEIKSTGKKS
ncbi:MAG: exodeoxyribonuclease VII large subunit [Bacteroidales bacterium]|nr:exodeoxyribonuclease VII large subunit [Bacteroidales bacterium]MDT8431667.1 exodeoxyribonuclease VII large subunit [Bacteroidales bacterium]